MTADYQTLNAAKSRVHYSPLLTHPVTPESHSHSVAVGFREALLLLLKSNPRTFTLVRWNKEREREGERAWTGLITTFKIGETKTAISRRTREPRGALQGLFKGHQMSEIHDYDDGD